MLASSIATQSASPREVHDRAKPEDGPHRVRRDAFAEFAARAARATGGRWAFLIALALVLVWAACGPVFRYSEMWQLVINTGTTIVTFLMVFLIQNAQNRESRAVQLKLDELIRAVGEARNEMIDIENLTEEHLERLGQCYHRVAEECHRHLEAALGRAEGCQAEDRMSRAADDGRSPP